MFFEIDPSGEIPIYEQIIRQIKFAVAGKLLAAGQLVPSVREVAKSLAINPNTVARAYRQLQDEGILTMRRGTGLAVLPKAEAICRAQRVELIRARLRQVLLEARRSHLNRDSVWRLVEAEWAATGEQEHS